MTAQVWLLFGTIATAVIGLVGTYLLVRQQGRQTKTTDSQQLIDQLQEINAAADAKHQRDIAGLEQRHHAEITGLRGEVSDLRGRVGRMEDRELVLLDYAYALRAHIDQRKEPPPPAWPSVLIHHLRRADQGGT